MRIFHEFLTFAMDWMHPKSHTVIFADDRVAL